MKSNLIGRLKNTKLPYSHALLPLYEAIVNAIQAVEAMPDWKDNGRIKVEIIREPILQEDDAMGDIIGFRISDNGIGFNEDNFNSFNELDSVFKASDGCRGVGRLLWLKAFEKVEIKSVYSGREGLISRQFDFTERGGVSDPIDCAADKNAQAGSEVFLSEFRAKYRKHCPKGADIIARLVLEHCLWYFLRPGSVPKILIGDKNSTIDLDDEFEGYMVGHPKTEEFDVGKEHFELVHIRVRSSVTRNHSLSYCAGTRQVSSEKLDGAIPGLFGELDDETGKFFYTGYVSSPYLDEHVRAERTEFDFDDSSSDELFSVKHEVTLQQIRDAALKLIERHLASQTACNITKTKQRIQDFVDKDAPQYKSVIKRLEKRGRPISPDISNKDLHLLLHKELIDLEQEFITAGHEIMTPKVDESAEVYKRKIEEYVTKMVEVKQSDLAAYVAHRRAVLAVLKYAIKKQPTGKYVREDLIHNLIMPMGHTSDQLHINECNLWVIDERLAFHNYLGSDKTFSSMPITDSQSAKQPDLLALNVSDYLPPEFVSERKTPPFSTLTVVEFKRPMRNDADPSGENPIQQAVDYLEEIRSGKVKTVDGRPIPKAENMLGYCYVICDVLSSVQKCARQFSLQPTPDGMGYYGYHSGYNAYIEVISYDRLVDDAMLRNKMFFDKLGLPSLEAE